MAGGRPQRAGGRCRCRARDRVAWVAGGAALDRDRVGQAAFGQGLAEAGGVPVAGVGDHRQAGQFPLLAGFVEHVQGQAPPLPVPDLVGYTGSGPSAPDRLRQQHVITVLGIVPALGHEQPPVRRCRRAVGHQVDADPYLAVAAFAQRAAVHPGHPRRVIPVLGEPHVVDRVRLRGDVRCGPPGDPAADLGVVPGRGGHELLELLVVHAQALGHRLHRLALAVQHQPAQVQLALGPLVPALERAEHLRGERLQTRADLVHLLRCHT